MGRHIDAIFYIFLSLTIKIFESILVQEITSLHKIVAT